MRTSIWAHERLLNCYIIFLEQIVIPFYIFPCEYELSRTRFGIVIDANVYIILLEVT